MVQNDSLNTQSTIKEWKKDNAAFKNTSWKLNMTLKLFYLTEFSHMATPPLRAAKKLVFFPGHPLLSKALEKEMATHSNILAWTIPCTEEPDGLKSMGVTESWTQLSH